MIAAQQCRIFLYDAHAESGVGALPASKVARGWSEHHRYNVDPVGRAVAAGGGAACLDDLLDRGDIFRGRADDREHDGQHCTHVDEIDGGRLVRNSTVNATFYFM